MQLTVRWSRVRRVPLIWNCRDWRAAARRLQVRHLIIDLEPLVVAWSSDEETFRSALSAFDSSIEHRIRVTYVTNSRRMPPTGLRLRTNRAFISRARKPWTAIPDDAHGVRAVVGDLLLTDGLLAWRLGVPFVHIDRRCCTRSIPLWPRLLEAAHPALRLFFEEVSA